MSEIKNPEELIMYIIVNKNLNMSTGKIAAQVSHGVMLIALRDQNNEKFQEWKNISFKKVVLKASEKEMLKIKESLDEAILIIDNGHTEVPPKSKTVLALPVMTREEAYKYVKRLRIF